MVIADEIARKKKGTPLMRASFACLSRTVACAAAFVQSRRLDEPKAAGVETLLHELFVQEPHRAVTRLLGRIGGLSQ